MKSHQISLGLLVSTAIIALVLPSSSAFALGKKKPDPSVGFSTPKPVRYASLREVSTTPFHIPNGKDARETIGADLGLLLKSAVGDSGSLRVETGNSDPCAKHLELEAGVSILQLDIAQFGITVGYSHSADSNSMALSKLTGEADVTIGKIVMNFGLWVCDEGSVNCERIASADATHLTADTATSVKMNFGLLEVGPDLIWKTDLGNIMRAIMQNGLRRLVASADFNKLPWRATVQQSYDPSLPNLVFFDAGAAENIGMNQTFEVYTTTPDEGACKVFLVLGYGHTVQVNMDSSVLQLDQTFFDPVKIRKGDIVKVRLVPGAPVCK